MITEAEPTIVLLRNEDGWWTARHPRIGVITHSKTRAAALTNLNDAVQVAQEPLADEIEPTRDWTLPGLLSNGLWGFVGR